MIHGSFRDRLIRQRDTEVFQAGTREREQERERERECERDPQVAEEAFRRSSSISQLVVDAEPTFVHMPGSYLETRFSVDADLTHRQTAAYFSVCSALDKIVKESIPEASSATAVYGLKISLDGRLTEIDDHLRRLDRRVSTLTRTELCARVDLFISTLDIQPGDPPRYEIAEVGLFTLKTTPEALRTKAATLGDPHVNLLETAAEST